MLHEQQTMKIGECQIDQECHQVPCSPFYMSRGLEAAKTAKRRAAMHSGSSFN